MNHGYLNSGFCLKPCSSVFTYAAVSPLHRCASAMNCSVKLVCRVSANAMDSVRQLYIICAAGYDDYIRANNHLFENNPYADLLYLETSDSLVGKGSTLHLPYYGAMYEMGALLPVLDRELLFIAAIPTIPKHSSPSPLKNPPIWMNSGTRTFLLRIFLPIQDRVRFGAGSIIPKMARKRSFLNLMMRN